MKKVISGTEMVLKKCADCKKRLFSAIETTKNQGKSAYKISEKVLRVEFE